MEQQSKDFNDYLVAIRKRQPAFYTIFIVTMLMTVSIALLLPAVYRSSSTILIEQQEIPPELVMSTVTSYASQRIQTIKARVMTRTNLLRIVEKYNLYPEERKYLTSEVIVGKMIENVGLDIISAEVVDPRTGRPSSATIAFSLSFEGESPTKVQEVANELTTLYLDENLSSRTQEAEDTSRFFKEETSRMSRLIDELETRLAKFKKENSDALPELRAVNLGLIQRKETELTGLESKLLSLDEKRFYLNGQLAQLDPGNPKVPGAVERLKLLRAEYASARSKYSDEHPDVVRLKNEIESLESSTGSADSRAEISDQIKLLEGELAQKRLKYSDEHPDVVSLKAKLDGLNSELAAANESPGEEYYEDNPDNPIYITIQTQLASVESEINAVKRQIDAVKQKIAEVESSLFRGPEVEREYLALKRDYENAVARYQETKAKQMHADVAKQLESQSKGERFTLIEPPAVPEEPVSPNRPAIIFVGFVLSIVCSLGFIIVADAISGTVRGTRGLQRLVGTLPLAVIPYELNLEDRAKTRRIKKRVVILFIAVLIFAMAFIHVFISPLDVLWFRVLRKIEILMA